MADSTKENCKYWGKCYQKNVTHREKYNHPPAESQETDLNTNPKVIIAGNQSPSSPSINVSSHNLERTANKRNHTSNLKVELPSTSSNGADNIESTEQNSNATSMQIQEMDITAEYNEVMKNLEGKNYLEIFQQRVLYSQKAEYLELLKSNEFIRHKFLVEMPDNFYKFWDFCGTLTQKGLKPEQVFEKFGLKLVGPFEFLAGKFNDAKIYEPGDYIRHWRFYYDPPEFQTIFVKEKSGIHYGFWRDEPKEKEDILIARNDASKGCDMEFVGSNCFEALIYYIDKEMVLTPFNRSEIIHIKKSLQSFVGNLKIPLNGLDEAVKKREKRVVTRTFHRAGLVVPYDRTTDLGYRALIESNANLKKYIRMFEGVDGDKSKLDEAMEKLQPIITATSIAVDECDFGTTLELGIDLFCSGHKELHDVIISLLVPGYSLLKRPQFIAIVKAHLEQRKKTFNLSIFDL